MFKVCLAQLNILIDNKHSYIEDMCEEYIAKSDHTDFSVSVTDAEIMSEDDGSGYDEGYLESLAIYRKIAEKMPEYNGFLMHGVVIDVNSTGVIFTAKSGVGKTTHTHLWQLAYGEKVAVINGDKPLVRFVDGKAYAYGTPWAGKENIHKNAKVSLDKVCFLERSEQNECVKLERERVFEMLFPQVYRPKTSQKLLTAIDILGKLISVTDFYIIKCNMDLSAAKTAYEGLGL